MPFALYEYDDAYQRFFAQTLQALARARSPLLAQMPFIEISGTVGSRVRTREGMDVNLVPATTTTEVTTDFAAVRAADYEQLYAELDRGSELMAEELVGSLLEGVSKITAGTGNVIDAGGQKLSFDLIYDMLDKIEFSVDDDGQLVLPSLVLSPHQAEKLQKLPPMTPQQEAKLAELQDRKREEALARRRRRRLS